MRYLLLLLAAPALAAEPGYLTYDDVHVQTVLTQDRPSWCYGMKMAFDIDGLNRAYYGCWAGSQGFVHIECFNALGDIFQEITLPCSAFKPMKE